jgi:cytochrome c-type biogenesis protein CcmH/NrfG
LLTPDILKTRPCLLLAKNLLAEGRRKEAIAVLQRRLEILPTDAATLALLKQAHSLWRASIARIVNKAAGPLPFPHSFLQWAAQRLRLRRKN